MKRRKRLAIADDHTRRATRELLAELSLLRWKDEYARTSNPLCAWYGLIEAIDYPREIPGWIRRYLYESARRLLDLVENIPAGQEWRARGVTRLLPPEHRHAPKEIAPPVAEALGFKKAGRTGRWNPFIQVADDRDQWLVASVKKLTENGTKLYLAYEEVARSNGVSKSTVERAWKKRLP